MRCMWQSWFGVQLLICHQSYEMSHQGIQDCFFIHWLLPVFRFILHCSVFEYANHRFERSEIYEMPLGFSFVVAEGAVCHMIQSKLCSPTILKLRPSRVTGSPENIPMTTTSPSFTSVTFGQALMTVKKWEFFCIESSVRKIPWLVVSSSGRASMSNIDHIITVVSRIIVSIR